jgi:hypothetical protein
MLRDNKPNQPDPERDLLDKLFGAPDEMADEDLDMLYEALSPDTNPSAIVHRLAEEAAVEHRTKIQMPPDHIQAALDATREVKNLDNLAPSKLRQILDTLTTPFTGAVKDPAYAYRNRDQELDTNDQGIIDELTDELREDWGADDSKG